MYKKRFLLLIVSARKLHLDKNFKKIWKNLSKISQTWIFINNYTKK